MICPNCNQVIDDDSKFCVYCGVSVQTVTTVSSASSLPIQEEISMNVGNDTTPNYHEIQQTRPNQSIIQDSEKGHQKKISPVLWVIAIALVVIAGGTVVFLSLTVFKKPQFNLNEYMYVLDSGFDGYGTVTIGINEKLLRESCRGQFGEKKITESSKTESVLLSLMSSGSFDKADHLSNGDNVTYVLDFNKEDIEKQYRIKIEYVPIEYEVSNLQSLTEYDVFDDLVIKIDGYSGIATMSAYFYETVPEIDISWISWDKNENLSNGDIVTFTLEEKAGYDIEEIIASTYGYKLKRTSYEYKVEGLEELIMIDDDLLQYAEIEYHGYPVDAAPLISVFVSNTTLKEAYPELELDYFVHCDGIVENGKELTIGLCDTMQVSHEEFESLEELKDYLHQYGYDYNGNATKTVTVSGLSEYVMNVEDIPDELVSELAQKTRENLDELVANNWSMWRADRPVESMDVIGMGVFYQKTMTDEIPSIADYAAENMIVLFFEIKAPADGETKTFYYCSEWMECIKNPDGTIDILGEIMTPFNKDKAELRKEYGADLLYGFSTIEEMMNYLIESELVLSEYEYDTTLPGY